MNSIQNLRTNQELFAIITSPQVLKKIIHIRRSCCFIYMKLLLDRLHSGEVRSMEGCFTAAVYYKFFG